MANKAMITYLFFFIKQEALAMDNLETQKPINDEHQKSITGMDESTHEHIVNTASAATETDPSFLSSLSEIFEWFSL